MSEQERIIDYSKIMKISELLLCDKRIYSVQQSGNLHKEGKLQSFCDLLFFGKSEIQTICYEENPFDFGFAVVRFCRTSAMDVANLRRV